MNNKICGVIITARVKSSRIPDKVIQKIRGRYTIEILLDNLIVDDKYQIILAIPENPENDILAEIATNKGIEVYRGYDDSPLHRLYYCAEKYGFEDIIRITADDIIIDSILMKNMVKHHMRGGHEYTYMRKCPEGCAGEVIKVKILREIVEKVKNKPVEFISYYLKNKCKTFEYFPDPAYQFPYRLTMDYEEDLLLLRLVFAALPEPIKLLDIIHFLKQHPYFLQINRLPTVTVYTSIYNHQSYLLDCLDSVMSQNYQDFEFIIFDDCSVDETPGMILEWFSGLSEYKQKKVKIIRNMENFGLPYNCNRALEMARGRYIMRIDSDDVMQPNCLETMVEYMKLENIDGVMSGFVECDDNLEEFENKMPDFNHAGCALYSKKACNELKFRDGLEYLEGKDFNNRFKKLYKFAAINEPLWKYRQHEGQKSKELEHPNNR